MCHNEWNNQNSEEIMFHFSNKKKIKVATPINLHEEIGDFSIVSASLGPRHEICILTVKDTPERKENMFPLTVTPTPQQYRVLLITPYKTKVFEINNVNWNFHFAQPIEDDHVLLVCSRSEYYDGNRYDLNGHIYNEEGFLQREFLLGDGIQEVQTTTSDTIWTSYFDEGVFGNYGWHDPIGKYGLRSWSKDGEEKYKYHASENQFIADCYALNVMSDDNVLFYYYMNFKLANIKNGKTTYFPVDVQGSNGFILSDDYVLFRGGYDDHDVYSLYQIKNSKLKKLSNIEFVNENDEKIISYEVSCRGSIMLLLSNNRLYTVDLKHILNT
jgi:hypothetical protein